MTLSLSQFKILVLGGSGFLGTHLVNALLEQGAFVRSFDRISNESWLHHPQAETCTGNFITGEGLENALSGIDIVYHLISTTIPSTSNLDPIADVQSNLIGTLCLLQKMQKMKVKKIVYLSSGGTVYGNPLTLPVSESHPLHPLCSYGIVKVAIENYLHMFSQLDGFKATVLRLSNPYGPLQKRIGVQGIIPTIFKKIVANEPIEIWGDGSVARDYIYVTDTMSALLQAGSLNKTGIYNVGSGIAHNLNQIIQTISKIAGKQPSVQYLPSRNFDVDKIYLDIKKASHELNWKPSVTLEEGCELYWKSIK